MKLNSEKSTRGDLRVNTSQQPQGQGTEEQTDVLKLASLTDSHSLTIIAAVAANGVIGNSGELPWHLPEDLGHFKQTTTGHPVIVGRKTYENIYSRLGGSFPDRTTIALSRQLTIPTDDNALHARDLSSAIKAAMADAERREVEDIYIAGGRSIYEKTLPIADKLLLTELNDPYPGDVTFPKWDELQWTETNRDDHDTFSIVTYERNTQ